MSITLTDALANVRTHNGTPVTVENLRWAATHEALCRSWIFDVLTGLADALEGDRPTGRKVIQPPDPIECCASGRCEVCSPGFDWGRDG